MILVEQQDFAATDQKQRAVADAHPFNAGRALKVVPISVQPMPQGWVLLHLGSNGLVGELHGFVKDRAGTLPEEEP